MDQFIRIVAIVFWGLLVLSVLVYIHEAGHFIAARIMGLRVREFFIGLPCRIRLARVSKKTGTAYGITPLLMGGYTLICGMDGSESRCLPRVLTYIYKQGSTTVASAAQDLHLDETEIETALLTLCDWGSIEETDDGFQTLARDAHMRTIYDKGHDFSEAGSTLAGEPHPFAGTQKAFLQQEHSHTYQALGFWGRTFVLINGIFINIIAGFIILFLTLSCLGISGPSNTTTIGSVDEGSPAATVGLMAGDTIVAIDNHEVSSWNEMAAAISSASEKAEPYSVTVSSDAPSNDGTAPSREGNESSYVRTFTIEPNSPGEKLGIRATTTQVYLPIPDACVAAVSYIGMTAAAIAQLFNPAHFQEVISQSSSVVGISVMAADAAQKGMTSLLILTAAISLSLGFMNLLPIPPLDGGKILIEAISSIIRRPVPIKIQRIISYVGVLLFILLFIVLLKQDIVRYIFGG